MSPWIQVNDEVTGKTEPVWTRPRPLHLREQQSLLAAVRRRDGDACRVCRVVVSSKDRRSVSALNYRILNPGTTLTVDGVVVVCRLHMTEGELVIAPRRPVYTAETAAWLAEDLPFLDSDLGLHEARLKEAVDGFVKDMDAAAETPTAPVVETEAAGSRSQDSGGLGIELCDRGLFLNGELSEINATVRLNLRTEPSQQGLVRFDLRVRAVAENELGTWVDPQRNQLTFSAASSDAAAQSEGSSSTQTCGDYHFKMPEDLIIQIKRDILTSESINHVSHKTSPSVGAPSGAGCDKPQPTEGGPNLRAHGSISGIWPGPVHEELSEAQRQQVRGGQLGCSGDNVDEGTVA